MQTLRDFLDRQRAAYFNPGKPLEKFHPLHQALDEALFTPGSVTYTAPHVRDGGNHQWVTVIVLAALVPVALWAMYYTGNFAAGVAESGALLENTWQTRVFSALGWRHNSSSIMGCLLFGALMYLPVAIVAVAVAGGLEILFALVRRRAPHGEFVLDAVIFSLILPPSIPLWIVALGMSVGCVLAPRGRSGSWRWNHPAILGWIVASMLFESCFPYRSDVQLIDYYFDSFVDSSLVVVPLLIYACCAAGLVVTGVRSWRPIATATLAVIALGLVVAARDPYRVHWLQMTPGTLAFVAIFIATDPASSPHTNQARLLYGLGYFVLVVLLGRFFVSDELLFSIFVLSAMAPLLDEFIIRANVRRRQARYANKKR